MITYRQAVAEFIETTELGYSIRSQDRLWLVFYYDLYAEGTLRYNRLYPYRSHASATSYDLYDDELVATSRREAEEFAAKWSESLRTLYESRGFSAPEVFVMNMGDDARFEDLILGCKKRARTTPKYKGSERAWQTQIEMSRRWKIFNQPRQKDAADG